VRTLDTKNWSPIDFSLRNPARRSILSSRTENVPLSLGPSTEDEADLLKQEQTVLWLLLSGTQELGAQDVHGNTPLHYLACAMWVNENLLKKLMVWEGGETVWKNSRNVLGYTPEELLEDGKQAEREQWKSFWADRM